MTLFKEFLKLNLNYTLKTIEGIQYVVPIVSSSCKHLKYKTYKINNDNIGESKIQSLEEYKCFTKELWSVEKADWCCGNKGYGCSTYLGPSADPYTPLPTKLLNAYITNLYGDSDFVKATDINFLYLDSSGLEILKHLPKIAPTVLGYSKDRNLIAQRMDSDLSYQLITKKGWIYNNMPKINNAWVPLFYGCGDPRTTFMNNCLANNTITCAINKYDPNHWGDIYIDNSMSGFINKDGYLEVQNRGANSDSGNSWWFYGAIGSNIFIKVDNPFIASNKFHALYKHYGRPFVKKYLIDNSGIGQLSTLIGDLYWGHQGDNIGTSYIDKYLTYLGATQKNEALVEILCNPNMYTSYNPDTTAQPWRDQAIYTYGSAGAPDLSVYAQWQDGIDHLLNDILQTVSLGTPPYDAVIMTTQPNFQGGWCCEIVMSTRPKFYTYYDGSYTECTALETRTDWPECMYCKSNNKSKICSSDNYLL